MLGKDNKYVYENSFYSEIIRKRHVTERPFITRIQFALRN